MGGYSTIKWSDVLWILPKKSTSKKYRYIRPVRSTVAMTGEISLRGNVLAIGGLKEKTMAAYSAGAKTVLIPEANLRDLDEIDPLARENLTFIPCKRAEDVLANALAPLPQSVSSERETETVAASVFVPNVPVSAPHVSFKK